MTCEVPDYLEWFKFSEPPFRLLPDLDFFFPSKSHKQALDVLLYGIVRGEGFMVLSGQAGSGKTMLLRLLLRQLPEDKQAAFIVTPAVSPKGLMGLLLEELGVPIARDRSELALMLKDFQQHVLSLAEKNKSLLIIVDEAQDLPIETVEQLRLLSNIETGKKKLIQILLVGQPEIKRLLDDPRLCQLTQRIVINETLSPLNKKETEDYVKFRLSRAGRPDMELPEGFISLLYKNSGGLPRLINRLMDRTLLMAAAAGSKTLSVAYLNEALSTLPQPTSPYQSPVFNMGMGNLWQRFSWALLGSLAGIVLCIALFILSDFSKTVESSSPAKKVQNISQQSVSQAPEGFPVRVFVQSARIHSKPFKKSQIVTIVKEGTILTALEEKGRWYRVEAKGEQDGRGLIGWLLKKQVERNFSASNTFPKENMGHRAKRTRPI